jgi:hypothetical protein
MAQFDLQLPKFGEGDLDDAKQRRKIMNYLYKLDEQLRFVLNNLDAENFTENFQQIIISSGGGSGSDAETLKKLENELAKLSTRVTQTANEIHELLRVIRIERNDELLVVNAVGVAGVDADAFEGRGGVDVLVHHALARVGRQVVPGTRLHKRIDEQVFALAGQQFERVPRALLVHVL